MQKELLEALNNRYATKKFDPSKTLSAEAVETLIEAVRLTPTSYGLQLMKLVVVENTATRAELVQHSFGQQQVADASHLFVLCREKTIDEQHISDYINNIATTRGVSEEQLAGYKSMMVNSVLSMPEEVQSNWMSKQTYIALGQLLTACAIINVDACPMEGFNPAEYNRVLDLDAKNLSAVLVVPVGYRAADDQNANAKKVRRATGDFLVKI